MMPSVTILLLVATACTAFAGHQPEWTSILKEGVSEAAEWARLGQHTAKKEKPAIVTFKHFVPPSQARDFVDKWSKYVGEPASKAPGNILISLDAPAATNAFIYGYSEWESYKDLRDFVEGKDNLDFVKFAADNDIKWEWNLLTEVGTVDAYKSVAKKEGKAFKVLGEVILEPHLGSEFADVWSDAAESVKKENGNLVYALRRSASDNFKFWIYSSWESEDAWKEHLKSDGFKDLFEWSVKNDVVVLNTPLISLAKY